MYFAPTSGTNARIQASVRLGGRQMPGPYTVVDLGPWNAQEQLDINDNGTLVVGTTATVHAVAYEIRVSKQVQFFKASISIPTGVNDNGAVALMIDDTGGRGGYVPGRYPFPAGPAARCPPLRLPGSYNYYTRRINAKGDLVGTAITNPQPGGNNQSVAFLSVAHPLGTENLCLPNALSPTLQIANGLNDIGDVVGQYDNGGPQACVFPVPPKKPPKPVDLNTLAANWAGKRIPLQTATAINNARHIVGNDRNGNSLAFYFDYSHAPGGPFTAQNLGKLPQAIHSWANDISENDIIVGGCSVPTGTVACTFHRGPPGVVDLNTQIKGPPGWQLLDALAVNSLGQIVGWGTHAGVGKAFLLLP
jgi:uncharacterized membrane protein